MKLIKKRKKFKNIYTKKKPIALLHIAKIALFKFRHEPWDGSLLPAGCFTSESGVFVESEMASLDFDQVAEPFVAVIGHSTCLIKMGGQTFLTDPVWSSVAGPLGVIGPKRRTPPSITLDELPRIDVVLLSHDHYDHLDKRALKYLIERDRPRIITGLGVGRHLKNYDDALEMNWYQSIACGAVQVSFVPAQHFSGRSFVFNKSLWGGFILEAPNETLYFPGDTGFNEQLFKDIDQRYGPIDIGIIPIGAYKPYNALKPYHLSPWDAVRVHQLLDLKAAIAIHFGTYQLSIESINSQIEDFEEVWAEYKGKIAGDFILPDFGLGYELHLGVSRRAGCTDASDPLHDLEQ